MTDSNYDQWVFTDSAYNQWVFNVIIGDDEDDDKIMQMKGNYSQSAELAFVDAVNIQRGLR